MLFRYRAGLALTSVLFLTAATQKPPARTQAPPAIPLHELYSKRALRRARIILQLQMLELRAERLERLSKALRRNLPGTLLTPLP